MTDVHNSEVRSRNMRAIRSKNTRPEVKLQELLERQGYVLDMHVRTLSGTPDIVLPGHRVAIFVNGCFWHGHDCYLFKLPSARREFWQQKIQTNRERDTRKLQALKNEGWRVLNVWECAIKGRLRQSESDLLDHIHNWIYMAQGTPDYPVGDIRCLPESVS